MKGFRPLSLGKSESRQNYKYSGISCQLSAFESNNLLRLTDDIFLDISLLGD